MITCSDGMVPLTGRKMLKLCEECGSEFKTRYQPQQTCDDCMQAWSFEPRLGEPGYEMHLAEVFESQS